MEIKTKTEELTQLFSEVLAQGFNEGYKVAMEDLKNQAWSIKENEKKWYLINLINSVYKKYKDDLDLDQEIDIPQIKENLRNER